MSKGFDAIIIGAGIIGAAIGYELSKRGRRTLNVDRPTIVEAGGTPACKTWLNRCEANQLSIGVPAPRARARASARLAIAVS